jgi:hypothetical protein
MKRKSVFTAGTTTDVSWGSGYSRMLECAPIEFRLLSEGGMADSLI